MKKIIFVFGFLLVFVMLTNVFAVEYVASVGNEKYESLSAAIEAAGNGNTVITLVNNINLSGKVTFPKGSNITLNLNNKELTVPTVENNYGIVVLGNLTITGKGIVNLGMYGIGVGTTGNLVIEDGTYKCQQGDYLLGSWNKAVIKGGVFDGNYCIANGFDGGTVEIIDGTFYSKQSTIVLGKVEIHGGTFNQNVDEYLATGVEMKQYNGLYYTGPVYKITVQNTKNGKVNMVSEAVSEQPVKVETKANKGYVLEDVRVKDKDGKLIAVKNGEFVMPESDVLVEVTFELDALDSTPQTGNYSLSFAMTICCIAMFLGIVIIRLQAVKK